MKWNKLQDKLMKDYVNFTRNKYRALLQLLIKKGNKEGDLSSSIPLLKKELNKLGKQQNSMIGSILYKASSRVLNNKKAINKILKTKWNDKHYSERIWKEKKELYKILSKEMKKAVNSNKEREALIKLVSKRFDVSVNNAKRLVDTEISNVINQSVLEQGKLLRKKKYKIVATIDDRTSEICRKLNNKTFDIGEEKIAGVNWVPAHPHCRSRIVLI